MIRGMGKGAVGQYKCAPLFSQPMSVIEKIAVIVTRLKHCGWVTPSGIFAEQIRAASSACALATHQRGACIRTSKKSI